MNNRIFQSVDANPNERFDIGFELVQGQTTTELPEEISILHRDIEETTTIIKNLIYTPESDKERYFNKLLDLSKFAFLTENENAIPLATNYLIVLREEILLSEGPRIKNVHMKKLGLGILGIITVSWMIFLLLLLVPIVPNEELLMYFIVCTGSLVGTWISFGARKFNITLQDLISIEEDKMSIYIRLPYIMVCAIVFLLLIKTGFLNLSIGNSTVRNWLNENIEVQLLFGVFTGLLESKLGIQIYNKANDFLTNNSKN